MVNKSKVNAVVDDVIKKNKEKAFKENLENRMTVLEKDIKEIKYILGK